MASDTHPEEDRHPLQGTDSRPATAIAATGTHMKTGLPAAHSTGAMNTLEAPGHEFILTDQESQGFLVTSPLMSEASLADEPHHHGASASAGSGAAAIGKTGSMDSVEFNSNSSYNNNSKNNSNTTPQGSGRHSNGQSSRTNSGSSSTFRSPPQSSAATLSSGQYQLSVATFHKRNQDTNSFRTGQQFLIKLDLKSAASEPFRSPMHLMLPRRMIQGHQKVRQSESTITATTAPSGIAVTTAAASADNLTSTPAQDPAPSSGTTSQSRDPPSLPTGDPENHFYLEVTVHLASSETIVQACPECCHKVEGKVRKPSNGPGAPSKAHGPNDNVDPGQILQFCVADNIVDFTHGTSTVMAKVLCSSTHHDKRGNNDRYFFKFSLMQYLNGQKIRVGSCRTKDILFTGNHKNKSMASFSEDKIDVKPRIQRPEDETTAEAMPAMVTGQSFYSEEPDSIPDDSIDKHGHAQSPYATGRAQPTHPQSLSSYNSPRHYASEHIPRIHEPSSPMAIDSTRQRQHTMDTEPYSSQSSRPPLSGQGSGPNYAGSSNPGHASSMADTRLGSNSGFAPIKSKSWNDTFVAPQITRIIPDVGDMLGGTEVTIFGSGFRVGQVPFFDSLPATNVRVLHADVLTCRTPPRIHPALVSVGFHSKPPGCSSFGRVSADAQFSYADKRGLVLAELVAEILVMERNDQDDDENPQQLRRSGTGLSSADNAGDRSEQRLGGLGDLRSRATRIVRRGSMRRDSSDVSANQRSGLGGSRLNPMTESPQRRSSHSPLSHEQTLDDDEEFERLIAEVMTMSVMQSILPTAQNCKALESAILNIATDAGELQHISLQNDQRHTMLHLAVALEMNQLVDYLLKERIEINAADWNGFTALHYAAWMGQTAVFETLERHGASLEALNCHQALPRHLFADVPGTPQEFEAMYHSKIGQHVSEPRPKPSTSSSYDNLKDDMHAVYSRAKKARTSSGNMYVKSTAGDHQSQASASERFDHHREPSHSVLDPSALSSSRHIMSSPPPQHHSQPQQQQQPQQHLVRPRPTSQSMHAHSHAQAHHGAQTRSPSPLRESYANPYSQTPSSGPRRYLHPVDVHPMRTGSLPSIRLEPDHHREHSSSSYHSSGYHGHHHHAPPSPSSSPSTNPKTSHGPSSPMHHHQQQPQHPGSGSHNRYPSSPSSYDHAPQQRSPQHYEQHQEERRSDRMLPSFGLNLPVPYAPSYQDESNRGHSPSSSTAEPHDRHGSTHVGSGQKRSGSYHTSPHDGPSSKAARTFDGPARPKAEHHEYDMQGPALPIDKSRSGGAQQGSESLSSRSGRSRSEDGRESGNGGEDFGGAGGSGAMDEHNKPIRRTSQASHTCPHPNCNKSFTRPFNLRAHMRVHTAERPYKCDTCALAFSRLHDRNRHAKLHTGIKPFECSFCHHQFIRPDALRRHLGRGGGAGCGQKAQTAPGSTSTSTLASTAAPASSSTTGVSGPQPKDSASVTTASSGQRITPHPGSSTASGVSSADTAFASMINNVNSSIASSINHHSNSASSSAGPSSRSSSGSSMRSNTSLSSISSSVPPSHASMSAHSSADWSQGTKLSERASGVGERFPGVERNGSGILEDAKGHNHIQQHLNHNSHHQSHHSNDSSRQSTHEQPVVGGGPALPTLPEAESDHDHGRRFESPTGMDEDEPEHDLEPAHEHGQNEMELDQANDKEHQAHEATLEATKKKNKSPPLPEATMEEVVQSS